MSGLLARSAIFDDGPWDTRLESDRPVWVYERARCGHSANDRELLRLAPAPLGPGLHRHGRARVLHATERPRPADEPVAELEEVDELEIERGATRLSLADGAR